MGEENNGKSEPDKYPIAVVLLTVILISVIFLWPSGEAKVKATLKVNAEELEDTGDRYVHLSVFVKNNTDDPIEIDELRYFTKLAIWGDPIARKFPDVSAVGPNSKELVGKLTIHEGPSDYKGASRKVKVMTNVGSFWTNVVEDYSYELK